ncbi:MAG: magnesium-dependent phosphatase-1 [Thermofilaceae archaeon]
MANCKLVALDLDKTLWDHPDVSSTVPPYRRVDADAIADSLGSLIRLRRGAREVLRELKRRGIALAVVSWNNYDIAVEALRALDLLDLFDIVIIEPHPHKDLMFKRLLKWARRKGIEAGDVVFLDDNPEMVEKVKHAWPAVRTLRFGHDVRSFEDLLGLLYPLQG